MNEQTYKQSFPTLSDSEAILLWIDFRDGSMAAFGALMRGFYRPLFNYGRRFTTNSDLLHDVIQDLFLHLWEARLNVSNTAHVRFYLFKALKNRLVSAKNKSDRTVTIDEIDLGDLKLCEASVEGMLIDQEAISINSERLKNLILQLSSRQQEVIHLRFYENLSNDQIADLMGINRQSVANILHNGLERLRKHWHVSFGLAFLLLRLLTESIISQ